jgi:hypothetical protein
MNFIGGGFLLLVFLICNPSLIKAIWAEEFTSGQRPGNGQLDTKTRSERAPREDGIKLPESAHNLPASLVWSPLIDLLTFQPIDE